MTSAIEMRASAVLKGIAVAALALLFLLVATIVVSRFVPGLPSAGWTDELVELLFAWLVFAGAAALWIERGHFAVDLLGQMLAKGSRARRAQELLVEILSLGFLVVFVWQASAFIGNNATELSPIFTLPKYLWYGIMPVCGVLMAASSIARIVRLVGTGTA